MEALVHGIVLAFGLILPLGVQNVFVFNQGAAHRKFSGAVPAVVTAGICDTLLITMAVAGVSVIVFNFEWIRNLLFIVGFLFLAYMGWSIWKSAGDTVRDGQQASFSARRQVMFAASVSLLNPHAIMDTIGVIGTASLVYAGSDKWLFALACVGVSWIWFFGLAVAGRRIGQIGGKGPLLKLLNQASALIVWGMALYMGYQILSLF
ncbi:amino acid transporter [Neobacillus piezotolerans]|uniref:Amino acid transporter n=1 Tax=Neobacillus piezotolerans TaxID=2259171 RepID=A0A3D8GQI5_9BACI|nr:LysE/ArgO family amino acid transporter [Neobacillus piezotolerans]RDU36698.1 amino acid transporter [Neobacillus piezotolerans]